MAHAEAGHRGLRVQEIDGPVQRVQDLTVAAAEGAVAEVEPHRVRHDVAIAVGRRVRGHRHARRRRRVDPGGSGPGGVEEDAGRRIEHRPVGQLGELVRHLLAQVLDHGVAQAGAGGRGIALAVACGEGQYQGAQQQGPPADVRLRHVSLQLGSVGWRPASSLGRTPGPDVNR